MKTQRSAGTPKNDAVLAACLIAVDPDGIGGISIRAAYGPAVDHFLKELRRLVPKSTPFRRVPLQITDGRLLGGLDLAATMQAGSPVMERGVLSEANGGFIVLAMAERIAQGVAGKIAGALDTGEIRLERDGFTSVSASSFGVIALDEGIASDERPPAALLDRLGIQIALEQLDHRDLETSGLDEHSVARARKELATIEVGEELLRSFCNVAAMFGIASLRAPLFAVKAARAHASLRGSKSIEEEDVSAACRLVLALRATAIPPGAEEEAKAEEPPPEQDQEKEQAQNEVLEENTAKKDTKLDDLVLEATRSAIPESVIAALQAQAGTKAQSATSGRAGAIRASLNRGRPIGARRGDPNGRARLNIVETLRAAAPWQKARRAQGKAHAENRVAVRREDFRVSRFKEHGETANIFVVDASGSSALHRLAEAKGAVELLLAECYVRRDQVAVLAFRGSRADLILPPTRSLARAKRSLSALPGGGGTPLASAIDAAVLLAEGFQRKGISPSIVILTDARANVARDGTGGRARAEEDAIHAAKLCRARGFKTLLLDTSDSPGPSGARLASELGATYVPLPRADASAIFGAVRIDATSKTVARGR